MADRLSEAGVPAFLADIKGDGSGPRRRRRGARRTSAALSTGVNELETQGSPPGNETHLA